MKGKHGGAHSSVNISGGLTFGVSVEGAVLFWESGGFGVLLWKTCLSKKMIVELRSNAGCGEELGFSSWQMAGCGGFGCVALLFNGRRQFPLQSYRTGHVIPLSDRDEFDYRNLI